MNTKLIIDYFSIILSDIKAKLGMQNNKPLYSVTSFPANCGDSFWITYGSEKDQYHILVDGGTVTIAQVLEKHIESLPKDSVLELLVVTHYDSDHIEGIRELLSKKTLPILIKEIWFNDYDRLDQKSSSEIFGAKMGEQLSAAIKTHNISWNSTFMQDAVKVPDNKDEKIPMLKFPGGMNITLLSPYQQQLTALKFAWKAEVERAGLEPGYGAKVATAEEAGLERFGAGIVDFKSLGEKRFNPDNAEGNGSSIAFLASFRGKCVLFSGDAFSEVIIKSLARLDEKKIPIHLLKVAHHGGDRNCDPLLIETIDCGHYLFSTNGNQRPTLQTMAYILKSSTEPTFYFNYDSQSTKPWENKFLKSKYKYQTQYPNGEHLKIDILSIENREI